MRILHTSDWHLGQSLHNYDRTYEHQCFLDWLLGALADTQADALLVSGDVFDTANPPAASQRQLYRFLQQARERLPGLDIVIVAGNHDSPSRLEAPGPLLGLHGTTVVGAPLRRADGTVDVGQLVLPLRDNSGEVAAWCIAIPYLRPGDVPRLPAGPAQADPYMDGIALLYRQAFDLARERCQPGQAIVAMGHCHMVDGQASADSERRILIGGTEALPASMFDPAIAYVALGHLHLSQRVGKLEHIRYSGSPLPMSFSEVDYHHQVLCIDLADARAARVASLPVPRSVGLMRVPARPAPVEEVLPLLEALDLPDLPDCQRPYLEVRVLLDKPEPGLRARVEAALAGKPVRLARIDPVRKAVVPGVAPALSLDELARMAPGDIFRRLYQERYGEEAPLDQVSAFAELLLPEAP